MIFGCVAAMGGALADTLRICVWAGAASGFGDCEVPPATVWRSVMAGFCGGVLWLLSCPPARPSDLPISGDTDPVALSGDG